jgi:hypothetical protein
MKTRRRLAMVILGILIGCLAILAVLIVWFGPWVGITVGVATALAVMAAYVLLVGPRLRRWGATDAEVARTMPGDELLPSHAASTTRAVTIDAPPGRVFPWLLQIGYGRGGWYSYDWLDNDGRRSADGIEPQLQRLAPGDRIQMMPGVGPTVREIEPNSHIVSAGDSDSWSLVVEALDGDRSRLISRWRQNWPRTPATFAWIAISDPGAFVMEQKMLRTIRRLAERPPVDDRVNR